MYSQFVSGLSCFLFVLLMFAGSLFAPNAQAVTRDTTTAGDWNTPGNWSGGVVPVAGTDAVHVDLDMTVSTDTSFGDNTTFDTSFWDITSGDTIISVAGGQTLTHLSGSTLVKVAGTDARLQGSGTLENYGLITVQGAASTSERLLLYTGGPQLHNYGTVELVNDGSQLQLLATNSTFVNQSGGTFRVNLPNTTDIARIESGGSSYYANAQFIQAPGASLLAIDRGVLAFAPPGGIGGVLDDAMFTSLFGATGSSIDTDAEVRIAGGINDIQLTGGAKLDRVKLGIGSDRFFAAPGGTFIEVTGSGIEVGAQLVGTNGTIFDTHPGNSTANSFTHGASGLIVKPAGVDWRIQGDGSFENYGTVRVAGNSSISERLLLYTGGPTFNNYGTVELTDNGSQLQLLATNATFVNRAGGTFRVNMPNATDIARVESGGNNYYANSRFIQAPGANELAIDRGVFVLAPPDGLGGALNDAMFTSLFGATGSSIDTDAEVRLSGGIGNITLTGGAKLNRVKLGVGVDRLFAVPGGTFIEVTGSGIEIGTSLVGSNGTEFQTQPGLLGTPNDFTHGANGLLIKPTGVDWRILGSGSFINNGTIQMAGTASTSDRLLLYTGGPTFENNGAFKFQTNNAKVQLSSTSTFNNNPTGTLSVILPVETETAFITGTAADTFSNAGTITVESGEFNIASAVQVPQLTGGNTLTGGTWRVMAGANNATLNLQPASSITTIGTGASVVMSEQGGGIATFLQLGSLTTLDGSLHVYGSYVQSVGAGATPLSVSGTLGGDGTITASDSVVFSGGTLDPSALSGGPGTLTINGDLSLDSSTLLSFSLASAGIVGGGVNDLVEVNGDLTLDGILDVTTLPGFGNGSYRLFNYTGNLTDNGLITNNPLYEISLATPGQVNLLLVPEPSAIWMLLGGLIFLRRRVSRHRNMQP